MNLHSRLYPMVFLLALLPVQGDPPAWWQEGIPPVIDPAATANNHGPANIGQAKWMTSEALRALQMFAPDIATQIRADLDGTPPDHLDRIVDLAVENPKTAPWLEQQKAPLLLGQLKAIALPFYKRLNAAVPDWVKAQIVLNHGAATGQPYWQVTGNSSYTDGYYPWNPATPVDSNKAIATIGQLKVIFSFDPSPLPDLLVPEVILLSPAAYTIADQVTLNARVTPKADATITLVELNGQTLPATPGYSTHTVNLVNGLNSFTLMATDNVGRTGTATATITRDTALPQLAITSPVDGAIIGASSIDIIGTVGGAIPLLSVTVNGVNTYINVGTFEAPNLSVVNGTNTFTATATDILGKVATASITVTGQAPVEDTSVAVTATPSVGEAPLNVMFNVVANVPGTIQLVAYDFEGYGNNVVTATAIAPLAHVYSEAGIFYPRITIRTTVGTFSNKTGPAVPVAERLRVQVTGGADSQPAVWSNLKRCVAAGDYEAADDCLSDSHRDGLKAMMIDLGPQLAAAMLDDFGELQQITLDDDVATYAGEITTPEGYITFLVDFINEDGSWKIFSF